MSTHSVLRNTGVVAAFTLLSRFLGLGREMLQSRLIGAGVEQSAFTLAFAIPNMSRKLFGEGALTAAFVPVFRGEVEEVGLARAAALARAVMTMVLLLLGAVSALVVFGLVGVGSFADALGLSPRTRLTMTLVAILIPYMLAICGAAFGMGVLNALGKFKASSFTSSLLNVVWIAALAVLALLPGVPVRTRIVAVSGAILFGGFLQMAFMFRCMARAGVSPRPTFAGWTSPKVLLVWRNLGVAALGAGAVQVNYMLDQVLAQLASPWAAGVIGYAERLMDLPLGVIAVAFGTVLLPAFSARFAKGDVDGARAELSASVVAQMFLMLPAAAGLFVLAPEVTRVVYEGAAFDARATVRVSRALAVYAVGLGFFGFQKMMVPWFQAQGDMKTPLRVSVATVCLNAVLNVLAVFTLPVEFRHVGLAASTVLCAAVGAFLLVRLAVRRNGSTGLKDVAPTVLLIAALSLAMAAALFFARPYAARLGSVLSLAVLMALGGLVYGTLALACFRRRLPAMLRRRRPARPDPQGGKRT